MGRSDEDRFVEQVLPIAGELLPRDDRGVHRVAGAIDEGHVIGAVQVGSHPDALALTPDEAQLLVLDSGSGDVAVVRTVKTRDNSKISADRALVTLIPVGNQPNDIVIKAFTVGK